jgi:uncharacterized membrane protein
VLTLTIIAALITTVQLAGMYGHFFTFSNSVLPGLDAAEPEQAVAAMRSINVKIVNPLFMLHFIVSLVVGAATGFLLLAQSETTPAVFFFAATGVYLVVFMITGSQNIPLNNALDKNPSTDYRQVWADFSPRWLRLNHVRTVLSMVSVVLAGLGLFTWQA